MTNSDNQNNERPPFIKSVIFDLPFVLFLADNFKDKQLEEWFEAISKGESPPYTPYATCPNKPSSMILGGGAPVYLPPSDVAPMYIVRLPQFECGMRFLRRVNPHRESVLLGEVPGDRTGRASFSTVEVRFDPRSVPHDALTEESSIPPPVFMFGVAGTPNQAGGLDQWVSYALSAVNHFIEHYRVICMRPWVYPVTEAIIQHFSIGTETPDGNVTWQIYMGSIGPMHGFGGSIPKEEDDLLRSAVHQPSPPDVRATLYQEILSHLELGRFRLAVVEIAVLFEAYITAVLKTYLTQDGRSDDEIEEILYMSAGRPHDVEHLAKVVIREQTGFHFNGTREFKEWKENVARLRNDVVHGRRFDISETEAVEALTAVEAAATVINENVLTKKEGS